MMVLIEGISLLASVLTTVAPAMQVLHILRTRSVEGLSVLTGVVLVVGASLSLLLGIQYQLGFVLILMSLSLFFQALMLHLVSWRVSLFVWAIILISVLIIAAFLPFFGSDMLSTRYTQQVAFIWGLIAATTFFPQLITTRRTRQTGDLSLVTLLCFAAGMSLWTVFAWLVQNWSLLLWSAIITVSVYELLRLKLTIKPPTPVAA